MCHDELCVCTHDDVVVVAVAVAVVVVVVVVVVVLAKLNLTPGGLGLVALRLGPEEMAAQVSYLEGG